MSCVQYLSYLRQFLVLPRNLSLELAPNQLLDLETSRFEFKLSGTCDVVVIDRDVQRTLGGDVVSAAALVTTIELKKHVGERDVRQAAAELISADLHAETLKPFALVTDLNDDWRILWLHDSHTIKVLRVPTADAGDTFAPRRAASLLLRRLLAISTSIATDRIAATALLEKLPIPISKRRKLSPIKERPRHGREEEDAASLDSDSDSEDVDGGGWEEEEQHAVLIRQVRAAMRRTPWMKDLFRRPEGFPPMSAEARNMFG